MQVDDNNSTFAKTYVCSYGKGKKSNCFPSSINFYPKDGIWSFRTMYNVMIDCEKVNCLKGVSPLAITEGGICWEGTEESTNQWNLNTGIGNIVNKYLVPKQIRTRGIKYQWLDKDWDLEWKTSMPISPKFDINMFDSRHHSATYTVGKFRIPVVDMFAKCCPTLDMMIELFKILKSHGNIMFETTGFKPLADGTFKQTAGKSNKLMKLSDFKNQYPNLYIKYLGRVY